ncbi:MAG: hypothetical protein J7J98_08475 [candidate division Zixibacteria bacterium]|nr:hypothetical protein [candidate division Zixibacteria bacterium]
MEHLTFWGHFGVWVAAFLTLGIYSFLYRDNPWYKFTEAVFIGISAGYWVVVLFFDNFYGKFWVGRGEEPMLWIGAILGLMMLMRLVPKIGWIARWPLAFIVGATSGLWMMNYLTSNAMSQVQSTIMPLFGEGFGASFGEIIGNLIIIVGTFTGLIYFFFSKEHKGAFGATARVGIWGLMITFGAMFGYTVMSRMSLLIGRVDFIFRDWLGLIQ